MTYTFIHHKCSNELIIYLHIPYKISQDHAMNFSTSSTPQSHLVCFEYMKNLSIQIWRGKGSCLFCDSIINIPHMPNDLTIYLLILHNISQEHTVNSTLPYSLALLSITLQSHLAYFTHILFGYIIYTRSALIFGHMCVSYS